MDKKRYESISEKANRLNENHRVILIGFATALVIGDHDTHKVEKKGNRWSCDCKWKRHQGWRDCSHIVAVKGARKDPSSQIAVARLADLLMEANVG